jgi:DNA-binding winged helix-turn-helix (wHTH) protein/TolB-like protein/tetratricopeptide (TPR) repeat protein
MDREPRGPIRFGIFEVAPEERELRKRGVKIRLQDQPFQILTALLENPGQLVSRDELRKRIWSADTFVDFDHGLYSAIKRLRDVLGDSAEAPRYIETVSKRGYRFIGSVEVIPKASVLETAQPFSPNYQEAGVKKEQRVAPALAARSLFAAFAGFSLLIVVMAAYPKLGSPTKTIAVVPFSYPSDNSFLSGVSEKLTNSLFLDLNKLTDANLRTKARSYVDNFEGRAADPIEIGRQMDTDLIVAGSLSEREGQLSIDVDLISVDDGSSLWAARDLRWEPFEVESAHRRILAELLTRLPVKVNAITRDAVLRTHPEKKPNAKAEELAARAQELFWIGTPESFNKSISLNKDAISIDQDFAAPYGGIASAYAAMANLDMIPPPEAKAKTIEWARRGLQLDDVDFGSLIALHTVHMCMEWTKESVHQNDLANGRFDKARERSLRFQAENPKSPASYLFLGGDLLMERRFKEAVEQFKIASELDPHGAWVHYQLGNAYLYQHRYKEAISELLLSRGDLPIHSQAAMIVVLANSGNIEEAVKKVDELKALSHSQYVSPLMFARASVALGNRDEAFQHLEAACNDKVPSLLSIKFDPAWDSIREDRRFEKIVRCVGL